MLNDLFQEFGKVKSVKIITDRFSGESRGFAFAEMDNSEEAKAAIDALDGKEFEGKRLKVNEARPRDAAPRSSTGRPFMNRSGGNGGFSSNRNGGSNNGNRNRY